MCGKMMDEVGVIRGGGRLSRASREFCVGRGGARVRLRAGCDREDWHEEM